MKKFFPSSNSKLAPVFYGFLSLCAFVLVWFLISLDIRIGKFFPSPFTVFSALIDSFTHNIGRNNIIEHALFSLRRVGIGYLIAITIGIPLGLIMARSKIGKAICMPLYSMIRSIPGLAWIPLAIIWFGLGEPSKHFLICMTALVGITLQTYHGALYVDQTLIGAAQMLGANKFQLFVNVIVPAAVPQIFAGLQGSFAAAWCAVIAAEMIRADEGAGWVIFNGMNYANTTQVIVGMVVIGVVGLLIAQLLKILERRLCVWNVQGK